MKYFYFVILLSMNICSVFADTTVFDSLRKYSFAVKLVNEEKNDQAITVLRQVINENPKLVYANVLIGICHYNKGDFLNGSKEIGIFVKDMKNAQDGTDKYPLALVYYLRCQFKINNEEEVKNYYLFVDKYPIPNTAGQLFTAETLVDASSNTTFSKELKKQLCDKGISILEKNKEKTKNTAWFNNTYGRAIIIKESFEDNVDAKINALISAGEYFQQEDAINNRSTVLLNLSVTYRLIGDSYMQKFWKEFSLYKKQKTLKLHYLDLKPLIKKALEYYLKSSEEIKNAKVAPGNLQQSLRSEKLELITKKEIDVINNDKNLQYIINSATN